MAYNREFGHAARRAIAGRPYRTIAADGQELTGEKLSAAYIADMVQGRIPSREKLESFLAGCRATPEQEAELFRLAGMIRSEGNLGTRPAAGLPALDASLLERLLTEAARRAVAEAEPRFRAIAEEIAHEVMRPDAQAATPSVQPPRPPLSAHVSNSHVSSSSDPEAAGPTLASILGRHESPRQRFARRLDDLRAKYAGLGYHLPAPPQNFESGQEWKTDEEADSALLTWLEQLSEENRNRPVAELDEAE